VSGGCHLALSRNQYPVTGVAASQSGGMGIPGVIQNWAQDWFDFPGQVGSIAHQPSSHDLSFISGLIM
jgi:hypothetical protein